MARRQRLIKNQAIASGAIVNSLFPEKVRDQLYEETKQQQQRQKERDNFLNHHNNLLTSSSGHPKNDAGTAPVVGVESALPNTLPGSESVVGGGGARMKQIADLFDETTIMFADLSGFTKWSSNRSPSHVFELLEVLYGAFDAIATRRNVFKVRVFNAVTKEICGFFS